VAGGDNKRPVDEHEATICRALGKRIAEIGLKLGK
jgi:NAD(P)H dehydrogenase (quinone)